MAHVMIPSRSSSTSQLICFEHQWTIDNYPQVDAFYTPGECLTSSQFNPLEDGQIKFSIDLYPKGHDNGTNQQWLAVFVKCDSLTLGPDESDGRIFAYKVAVVSDSGELVNQCVGKSKFQQDSCHGFAQFMNRGTLFIAKPLSLLPKQKFTLQCEISYLLHESVQISQDEHLTIQRQMVSNMSSLLGKESLFCQVSFKTSDGVIMNAHRCILMSASTIFDRIVNNKSRAYGQPIELRTVSSEVFREVLNFIYTGKVHRLDKHKIELLLAAEKFHLDLLKSMCENYIRASHSPEEAHQLLVRLPLAIMPDVCLLSIFDYVPLMTLIVLGNVCSRWKSLLQTACARRTHLTVLVGWQRHRKLSSSDFEIFPLEFPCKKELLNEQGIRQEAPEINSLLLKNIENSTIDSLFTNVPKSLINLTHLRIFDLNTTNELMATHSNLLLQNLHKLISLKMRLSLNGVSHTAIVNQFAIIASLSSLTHLTMKYDFVNVNDPLKNTQIQPPLPPALRELNYYSAFDFDYPIFLTVCLDRPQLQRIAISKSLLSDGLNATDASPQQDDFRFESDPIAQRISNFCFTMYMDNLSGFTKITNFVNSFRSLTSLHLSLLKLQIRDILPLTTLTQLVHLKLSFRLNFRKKETPITGVDPQFGPLQVLELDFMNSSQASLTQFSNIGHTFPNIQVIRLDLNKLNGTCTNCPKKHPLTLVSFSCLRPPFNPLKKCAKLKKIYVKYHFGEFVEWTFDQASWVNL